jgi:hypothetical protein
MDMLIVNRAKISERPVGAALIRDIAAGDEAAGKLDGPGEVPDGGLAFDGAVVV